MPRMRIVASTLLVAATLGFGRQAYATWPDYIGTRAVGMGGALRAAATGDAGPMLNPSGMALARAYAVEAGYQLTSDPSSHRPHLSVVDSTSATGIAAGLHYTYVSAKPGNAKLTGHEAGLAVSIPFGGRVFLGGQAKYYRLSSASTLAPPEGLPDLPEETTRGFTFDLGATIRVLETLNFAVVGYNLADLDSALAPVALGTGAAYAPLAKVTLAFDTVFDFTTYDDTRETLTSLMGGVEYLTDGGVAVRVGGGRNGPREAGYVSAGASAISELGAVDVGISRDLSGDPKLTMFVISARLFAATGAVDPG